LSEGENAVPPTAHEEHVRVSLDAGHVIYVARQGGRSNRELERNVGHQAAGLRAGRSEACRQQKAGDGGEHSGVRLQTDSFDVTRRTPRTPRSRVTVMSGQTARMSRECWANLKRKPGGSNAANSVIRRQRICIPPPTPSGSGRDRAAPLRVFCEDG